MGRPVVRRIDVAAAALVSFIRAVMGRNDRCTVASFDEKLRAHCELSDEGTVVLALVGTTHICGGRSNIWDAFVVAVVHFCKHANKNRPWKAVLVTDGEDNNSLMSIDNVVTVLQTYNSASDNFCFIIGVGGDVDHAAMRSIAQRSGSLFIRRPTLPSCL